MAGRLRKRVGNYYIGRTLGEGTYAKVKYGQHVETGEAVAIKILEKAVLEENRMQGQIKREIHILKQLHHPNIVDLREVMASKDSIYLVMELVPGGELFDRILLEGAMKEEKAKEIFAQLLDGLEYCHRHKIYHRDLKPENVLLTSDGCVKLSDFGLGALPGGSAEDRMLTTTCGTPNYVAPEVLAGTGYAGGPADIWSLGVLLYVITSGRLPFEEMNLSLLYRKLSRAEYKKPAWFSDLLLHLLDRMLQPKPDDRATFGELRAHPWMKGVRHESPKTLSAADLDVPLPTAADIFRPTVEPKRLTQDEAREVSRERGPRVTAGMNAFQLMTAALDISALFERREDVVSRSTRFTSKAPSAEILGRLEAATESLGGAAKRRDAYRTKLTAQLSSGPAAAVVELVPILPGVQMVEFVRASGSAVAFHQLFRALLHECRAIVSDEGRMGTAATAGGGGGDSSERLPSGTGSQS